VTGDYLRKAERSLAAARLLLDHEYYDEACSRAYYAMFEAARAALHTIDAPEEARSARSHSGVIAAFARYVVSAGLVSAAIGRTLGQAQNLRLVADYRAHPLSADEADQVEAWGQEFLDAVAKFTKIDPPGL